ncbi:MAG: hypothetical protein ACK5RF_04000, partial [Pirellula sp.]
MSSLQRNWKAGRSLSLQERFEKLRSQDPAANTTAHHRVHTQPEMILGGIAEQSDLVPTHQ